VSSRSDRVGIRLEGQSLHRHASRRGRELLSEGVVRGSVKVPTGGEPVLFLADHPVTGGYPVVAVVRDADIDLAAQAVPGQTLRTRDRACQVHPGLAKTTAAWCPGNDHPPDSFVLA
jgi:allophanate hydrolase subunit 2